MRLTTKGRFAVTAILDLALNETDKPVTLADISERQSISLSYLEQLFSRMRREGIVKSVRGPGGGYHLAKKHQDISFIKSFIRIAGYILLPIDLFSAAIILCISETLGIYEELV